MTYSSSSLPSAESASSANYAHINKFRANVRRSLHHQLRGEVLERLVVAVAAAVAVVVAAQAHRQYFEWRRAVRA